MTMRIRHVLPVLLLAVGFRANAGGVVGSGVEQFNLKDVRVTVSDAGGVLVELAGTGDGTLRGDGPFKLDQSSTVHVFRRFVELGALEMDGEYPTPRLSMDATGH